ncbi:Protein DETOXIFICATION 9 [Glycine soja]
MYGAVMEESSTGKWGWMKMREELKKVGTIAAPMAVSSVLQYLLPVVSLVMVGHLNQLSLSSVAIATSLTNVSGFSVLSGMAGGLETLCGQAFGAGQYEKFGLYTYTAIISLSLVCFPITILWIFNDKILTLLGQDPTISLEVRKYAIWLIPALFGSAILKPLTRFFQTQSLISPMILTSAIALCFHVVTCWTLVFKLGLGHVGAAISFSLCVWFNVIMLLSFVRYSSACEKTRISFSKNALVGVGEFFRFAVPAAVMWWACEILVLLAGLFPNPNLTISTLHFTIPYGFGAAARVSNELGAGNPQAVHVAVSATMFLAVTEGFIVSATLFGCRHILGYAYSDDRMVVHYVAVMIPLLCLSIFTDSLQGVLSGVARGSGWQHLGAYVNLGAFYLVGIPVGILLGFVAHFRAKGLWIGIVTGSIVQSILLSLITALTNWKKQAMMARERVFDAKPPDVNGSYHMTKKLREMMGKEEATPLLRKSEVAPLEDDDAFCVELKRVGSMAAPMVAANMCQYLLQVVSLMMVGHLGVLVSFSGVAIATSFAEVTGFCVLMGMAGALETLCGQTYGAEEFSEIGNYTFCAIVTLLLVCLPISMLWIFVDKILLLFGQDPEISHVAHEYCIYSIPALYGFAVLQCQIRYFQTQSMIFPMVFSSIAVLLNTTTLHYIIPYAVGASASTRISNELGAGNPKAAQGIVRVIVIIGIVDGVIVSIFFVCCRHILGYAYSNDKEVVDYVSDIVPILCGSFTADSLIGALSGIARGGGFQQIGAYVNLGAYYLVGVPLAFLLGFVLHFNAKGLWMGSLTGSVLQVIILTVVTVLTDWQKEATKARVRIVEKSIKAHNERKKEMEETLLPKENKRVTLTNSKSSSGFVQELKNVSLMAAPMVVVSVSQFLLQVVSLMMAGHLGELSLAGVALATSFADVTGFSILMGMAGALETQCGQSFGAEQFHKLGNYVFCAILSLILSSVPISIIWIFMDKLLILLGQDHAISLIAGNYCIWLIPALFGYAVLQALVRYFQTQSLIFPMLVTSVVVLVLHIPICWVLVFGLGLGQNGAAISIGISYWLSVMLLLIYTKYYPSCQKTKIALGSNALRSIKEFFFLAIPSALMICFEWWSFELVVILAGLLPNPKLETSVLSICLNICTLHYFIPYGTGAAVSTRVSNELGARRPQAAREAVFAVIVLAFTDAVVFSSVLFCFRHVLGFAFSNEMEVVHYVAKIVPVLCLSFMVDGFLGVLCGIVRGSGWQKIGAITNLVAYYAVGIPVSLLFGFGLNFNGKGLWIGILTGSTLQTIILALLTAFTNWEKQASLAIERLSEPDETVF